MTKIATRADAIAYTVSTLPTLPMGQHYVRITYPISWCQHDHDSPRHVAAVMARNAGLQTILAQVEGGTVAVYAIEPDGCDALAWHRYRAMPCSSAQRVG